LSDWLKTRGQAEDLRLLLSLQDGSQPLVNVVVKTMGTATAMTFLSGPEGGLSAAEEALATAKGFASVTLGPRVLRSETAPLACLSLVTLTGHT
jgi:16S rRNA (uracil1498-N3)-methyltransferase